MVFSISNQFMKVKCISHLSKDVKTEMIFLVSLNINVLRTSLIIPVLSIISINQLNNIVVL